MFSAEEMGADQEALLPDGRGFANISSTNTRLTQIHSHLLPLQYTGLKDKQGKEIYEGDFLKYTRFGWRCLGHPKHDTDLVTHYEVRWNDEYHAFSVENKSMSGCLTFNDSRARKNEIEVIGNIYENKELLETERIEEEA